ncbi:tRNA pseudouridine(38-40) synthase TruA [Pediococcus inopinatus]|uniref:tRNA pseudouridine synthase A n=1 Tax=Pediococcus inopinatus TaxID=114090 RepID=A0ABZ0Q5T0_9LACO|nr:tRNA pseudouridine(38-40) synthase TruA [Pediococcus inopinatus]WPC22346.1 tRNA pseudouridine(38-40) synthase TruA [Pediococcus inopinatus]
MYRYKITIAYDGTNFAGFQKQPKQRTVEEILERAVNKIAKKPAKLIKVYGSGRTDAGVHALGQVVHFDIPFSLSDNAMLHALNSILPLDIEVLEAQQVTSEFHARYGTQGKRYRYRLALGEFVDPFKRNYTAHWKFPLDLQAIQTALPDLIGEHDFSSFCAAGGHTKTNIREIYEATAVYDKAQNEIVFEFYGSGFLYNMVRIMVAVLIEIGSGKRPEHDIIRLLEVKNRDQARVTAPASGLYLKKVYYPKNFGK